MPGNDEIDMLCAKCGRVRLHYFHTIKSMQGVPAEAERYHAYEPRISLAGTGADVFDVAMADLTASVMRIKAERDEMDEAIHAAHAAAVKILPDYRADNGFPVEAVNALGEEIEELRKLLEEINMKACYASEENTDARYGMLLWIGTAARKALGRPDPIESYPYHGLDAHPDGYEGLCACRSCISDAN